MKLDEEQELAAKYITGHSLIIAGAGSGKTTTLVHKVKHLIENGIKPSEILVISFTNETVENFKSKCHYKIDIMTFHKLANKILHNKKDIVSQEVLEDCIKDYFKNISEKLQRKLFHMIYYKIYLKNRYTKNVNKFDSSSITSLFYRTICQIKAHNIDINNIDIQNLNKNDLILLYCLKNILNKYQKILNENNAIDFDGLITEATEKIKKKEYRNKYKHILVDEYQDISKIRLDLLKSLINDNNSILTAVGDDFQSIYGFNGSNINLFYNFQNHFKDSRIFYIKTSYRCPKKIIEKAGKFIMKNPFQIKKELKTNNKIKGKIIDIKSRSYGGKLEKLIKKYQKTKLKVLILSRNGFDINFYFNKNNRVENSYIVYKNKKCENIRYLTIHKSKGLEADIVIVINVNAGTNGFPSISNDILIEKIINNEETFPFAEERRLFYVALTRTKSKVYLIRDRRWPSPFLKEI